MAHHDFYHVFEGHQERLRQILTKFDKMWDGFLKEINLPPHRIILKPEDRPVMKRPSRTRLKVREFVAKEIDRLCKANVIETATAEWASPVVMCLITMYSTACASTLASSTW